MTRSKCPRKHPASGGLLLVNLHPILAVLGVCVYFPLCTFNILLCYTRLGPYMIGDDAWRWTHNKRCAVWLSVAQCVLHFLALLTRTH